MAELSLQGLDFTGPAKPIGMDPIEAQSKLAQLQTYNLDAAAKARNFGALRDYGQAAAAGDQSAMENLASKYPEAANILANIAHTSAATTQQKFETASQKRAALAKELSQLSDPSQRMAYGMDYLNQMEQNKEIHPQMAQHFRNQLKSDPRVLDAWMYQNLPTTEVPEIQARRAQANAAIDLQKQRGLKSMEAPITQMERDENGVIRPRRYSPPSLPGVLGPSDLFNPSAPMTTPPTGAAPSSSGPGSIRRMSFVPEPSTYIGPSSTREPPITFDGQPPAQYAGMIAKAASRYGVPEELLSRALQAESNFNPNAVGVMTKYGTAKGMGQFIDSTAAERGVNQKDPESSINGAASYLADLKQKHGSWQGALRGYLGSTPNPRQHPSYFTSGLVPLARQLDNETSGVAPKAPAGTTAPVTPGKGEPITVPAPDTSMMPSTEAAPEPPPGATETSTTDESGATTNVRETPLGRPPARGAAPPPSSAAEPASPATAPPSAPETRSEAAAPDRVLASGGAVPSAIRNVAATGADTVVSPYDTGSPHPDAKTLPPVQRVADSSKSGVSWGPTQEEIEAQKRKVTDPLDVEKAAKEEANRAEITSGQELFKQSHTEANESQVGLGQLHVIENALNKVTTGLTAEGRQVFNRAITEAAHMLSINSSPEGQKAAEGTLKAEFEKLAEYSSGDAKNMALIKTAGAQLAFSMVKALGSREAVQVVNQVMSIKPNLGLSNEENQAIVNALRQGFQRSIDRNQYLADNHEKLGGYHKADLAFNKEYPPEIYASRVVPFEETANPKDMKNGVTYDLSHRGDNFKGVTGVWNSERGRLENLKRTQ